MKVNELIRQNVYLKYNWTDFEFIQQHVDESQQNGKSWRIWENQSQPTPKTKMPTKIAEMKVSEHWYDIHFTQNCHFYFSCAHLFFFHLNSTKMVHIFGLYEKQN